ncbi:hypothetical protein L6R52_13065 [Myxococcota bacterium]|nr:hypothetical protein [Myxococcota bacterium]
MVAGASNRAHGRISARAPGAALTIAALALAACSDWREQVAPGVAVAEPSQETLASADAIPFERGELSATLKPRARYTTKAYAVAVDTGLDDGFEDVMSIDVALAWGPAADPAVLKTINFHLKRRYVSMRWSGEMPLSKDVLMRHMSNHHLIPATPELQAELERVEPGDLLELEGMLVDVDAKGTTKRTSLVRHDDGNGACEILYVERATITKRG